MKNSAFFKNFDLVPPSDNKCQVPTGNSSSGSVLVYQLSYFALMDHLLVDGPPSIGRWSIRAKYCRVPARWGLRRTTLAPGSDETRTRDPLVC